MKVTQINSVREFIEIVNALPNNYLYRGHSDARWVLQSSLERILGPSWDGEKAKSFEDYSLKQFCSKFHLYDRDNLKPTSKLAWLAVMQHHGVPTRLLDFTESPYVALYFAVESYNPLSRQDLALYALDYSAFLDRSIDHIRSREPTFQESRVSMHDRRDRIFEEVVDRLSCDVAWITEPDIFNSRLDRQAGSFLLSGNISLRIEEILERAEYAACEFQKYVVPYSLYEGIFSLLRKMNITSKSLYGDLDGLARSIRMEMQVYASGKVEKRTEVVSLRSPT